MIQEHQHRWVTRLEIFGCQEAGCTAIALDDTKRDLLAKAAIARAREEVLRLLGEEAEMTPSTGKAT